MIFGLLVIVFALGAFNDLKRIMLSFAIRLGTFCRGHLFHRSGGRFDLRFFAVTGRGKLIQQKYDAYYAQRNENVAKAGAAGKNDIDNPEYGQTDGDPKNQSMPFHFILILSGDPRLLF